MEIFNKSTNILHKNDSDSKYYSKYLYDKSVFYSRFWSYLPFVKEVYLCNSVAIGNANKNSDIDLLIVTQKNSLFLARFFWMLFFYLSLQRSVFPKKFGKICPSFWIEEDLRLIDTVNKEVDPYFIIWKNNLISLKSYSVKTYPFFIRILNRFLGHLMIYKIRISKKYKKAPEGAVIVNFRMLKLHFNDKRIKFLSSLVGNR